MIVKQHVEVVPLLLSQKYVNNPHSCQRTKTPTHIDCKLIWELTSKIRLSSADKLLPFTGNISKLLTSRSRVKDLSESSRKIQALVSFFLSLFFLYFVYLSIQGVNENDSPRFLTLGFKMYIYHTNQWLLLLQLTASQITAVLLKIQMVILFILSNVKIRSLSAKFLIVT